jgi:predicted porin
MKKSLLALAAMGAFAGAAQAQSSVTVYGLLDTAISSITTDTTTRSTLLTTTSKATDSGNSGRTAGSRLGFRGVEDMGGGLKAGFTLEFGIDHTEQANGIGGGTRLGFVDLSGGFGAVALGRQVSSTKIVNDVYTVFGNMNFNTGNVAGAGLSTSTTVQTTGGYVATSAATNAQSALTNANGGERISNLVRYTSPSFSGFTASAGMYSMGNDTSGTAAIVIGDANGKGTDAALRYTIGDFSAMAGFNKYETTNGTIANNYSVSNTVTSLGASYDAKVAKLFAAYNQRTYDTGVSTAKVDFKDTTLGVSAPFGNVTAKLAYSFGDDKSTATSTDKSGVQIGAEYMFSKRTNVYAIYGAGEAKSSQGTTSTNTKVKASGAMVGMKHTF